MSQSDLHRSTMECQADNFFGIQNSSKGLLLWEGLFNTGVAVGSSKGSVCLIK